MELEHSPSLPHAHQQIRLGDSHASTLKWSPAIDYYSRAIEQFQGVQSTLQDKQLISIIQAQIEQCEKDIHLCRLKDRAEQAAKAQHAERLSRVTRAHSTTSYKESTRPTRPMQRHNTFRLDNTAALGGHGGMDSFAAEIFAKKETGVNPKSTPPAPSRIAKKNQKKDSHKIEELQISYDAMKSHYKAALDDIDRLKQENDILRTKREESTDSQPGRIIHGSTANTSRREEGDDDDDEDDHEDEEEPDTELEATL